MCVWGGGGGGGGTRTAASFYSAKLCIGVCIQVSIKNFYFDLLTASIHSFLFSSLDSLICKLCLVYHLIELDASRQSYSSFSETYLFLSVQIQ